ncbi:MAG: sulfite exporter TauE/SafE family protein [Candidatus Omnitrophica bacterium]|nr:sulfite exporter TauE/SafE family protein [Candidatus Omnitrophota bacterium]
MSSELIVLLATAASIGFVHTILGPDHYLPFIVMAKARGWSISKTSLITFFCGIGHILSSVILGFVGIGLGIAVSKLEFIEANRGELAAWLLIAFGFTYFAWGLHQALKSKAVAHNHLHSEKDKKNITPWILFTIFVFGPCEPLIPILMYPAAKGSIWAVVAVAAVFGIVTISTMLAVVLAVSFGLLRVPLGGLQRYSHALAGLIIFASGGAIKFLGL